MMPFYLYKILHYTVAALFTSYKVSVIPNTQSYVPDSTSGLLYRDKTFEVKRPKGKLKFVEH